MNDSDKEIMKDNNQLLGLIKGLMLIYGTERIKSFLENAIKELTNE
jgi:hypothetical protein